MLSQTRLEANLPLRPSPKRGPCRRHRTSSRRMAGVDSEPHGQFLDHVQHRNQQQHQRRQATALLRAALGGGDHIAGVSIGQHYEQAESQTAMERRNEPAPRAFDCASAFIARVPAKGAGRRPEGDTALNNLPQRSAISRMPSRRGAELSERGNERQQRHAGGARRDALRRFG
jgi:hypothetical protein